MEKSKKRQFTRICQFQINNRISYFNFCFSIFKKMTSYPKKLNGLCIGVLSGDRVLFQGPPDTLNGGYKQKILHLTGIQAPKVDTTNGNDDKFGFASRQYLRVRLIGKQLPFVVEKKVNETELGYVMYEGKDISIQLLCEGLAKIRNQNIKCDHFEDYKDAEQQAKMAEAGLWSQEKNIKNACRYLCENADPKEIAKKFKGKFLKGIVEQIHPSKAQIYFPVEGIITTLTFSEIQVVVLSEKVSKQNIIIDNETVKSNVRQIRSVLESSFLHKDVDVHVTGYGQTLTGYLTNSNNQDVRKILLKNGFAKLAQNSLNTTSTKEFMELKKAAQIALEQSKGLWKQQQVTKSHTLNEKSYIGTVVEIHSGDSFSVLNPQNGTIERFYFPNTRAPASNLAWSFEAKQALRRKAIGQKVKVEVEFSKMISGKSGQGEKTQPKNFVYASIFLQNLNLACYMLELGLLNLQPPRVEEEVTKYLEDLKQADQKGKKQRKGIHGKQIAKIPYFNDLSGGKGKKIDVNKSKNMFSFLKDEKYLTGVIDLVLNGSRFKLRFNQNAVMVVMVLHGVRALPNEGDFKKISEQALQYSKANALQRDVAIELRSVDSKGVFQGVIYINKQDYGLELLEKGLAVCMGGKFLNKKYQEAECLAKKNRVGLWALNLNLSSLRGDTEKQFNDVNFCKNGSIIEVNSRYEIYVEPDGCKRVQVPQDSEPVEQVQVGGLYAAQFDGSYYRGKVIKQAAKGKYLVFFIDYGNYDQVPKNKIAELPEKLKKQKSPIYRCSLYGLDSITEEGQNTIKNLIGLNLKIQFKLESETIPNEDPQYKIILWQKENCINLEFLEFGDAQCTISDEIWIQAEQKARKLRQGKWSQE